MVVANNHEWGDKLENGFDDVFGFIPNLLGAIAIVVIGYFVAKLIGTVVSRLLYRGGLDRTLESGQGGRWISRLTSSPSRLLGSVTFWALFLGVLALAATALGIEALTDFVGEVFAYLPNVIAAFVIFVVAGAIAAGVSALIGRTMGDTATGRIVGSVVPILVMAIAGFMILDQLKIAEDIVRITYAALMGAMALGLALAFGLGGRDVAARILEGAYQRGQGTKDQVRRDLEVGRRRAAEAPPTEMIRQAVGVEGDAVAGPPGRAGVAEPAHAEPAYGEPAYAEPTYAGATGGAGKVERVGPDEPDRVPPGSAEEVGGGAQYGGGPPMTGTAPPGAVTPGAPGGPAPDVGVERSSTAETRIVEPIPADEVDTFPTAGRDDVNFDDTPTR